MLHNLLRSFFADYKRIYAVLPRSLRCVTWRVFGLVFIQGILEVCSILFMSFMAASLVSPERLMTFPLMQWLLDHWSYLAELARTPLRLGLVASSCVVTLITAKNVVSGLVAHKTNKLGEDIALFGGEAIFRHFLYSPYITHLSGDSHSMFHAIAWRGDLGRMIIHLMSVYSYAVITLCMALMLVVVTPGPVLIVMGTMLGLAVYIYLRLRGVMDRAGMEAAEWTRLENKATMNAMNGAREMLIYRQQETFFDKFDEASTNGVAPRAYLNIGPSMPSWILESAGFMSILAAYGVMAFWLHSSSARIAAVLAVLMLVAWRVLPLLNRSLTAIIIVRGTRHAAMDCLTAVEEALRYTQQEVPVTPTPDFTIQQGITFSRVCFRYPEAEEYCLHDVSFAIPKGSRVGIIGASGAGKSTIAALLSGLIEPTEGEMLVDGAALVVAEDRAAYCAQVGYVPQSPYILAGSLAENVAFSQWGKPWDEEKVLQVCRMAELDIVEERGIDATLGTGGVGLSGGQAQRLSIARALYANPSILILDEATSALDVGVECAIMDTIFSLTNDITTIIIAHRLSTVERCDTLIWICAGTVHAIGKPDEILPRYREFMLSRRKAESAAQ